MSNGLSQAEIDALLRGEAVPGVENEATPVAPAAEEDPDKILTPEEIAAAYAEAGGNEDAAEEVPMEPMSQEEIEAAFAAVGMDAPAGTEQTDAQPGDEPEAVEAELENPADDGPKADPQAAAQDEVQPDLDALTDIEIDAMGEIGNISMGTSATTLFALLNRRVDITTPKVTVTTMARVASEYPLPFVAVEVRYTVGLQGTNILFLREDDVKIITDLMLGGDGTNTSDELGEMHMSCISEVMNQMMGSASTSLAKMLGMPIDISPPQAYQVNLADSSQYPFHQMDETIVKISFDMVVDGLINSEIMQVTPIPFAREMVKTLMAGGSGEAQAEPAAQAPPPQPKAQQPAAAAHEPQAPVQPQPQQPPQSTFNVPNYTSPFDGPHGAPEGTPPAQQGYPPYPYPPYPQYPDPSQAGYPPPQYGYPPYQQQPQQQQAGRPVQQPVEVRAMQFNSFDTPTDTAVIGENMDLLMDVPLQVSVELGKSKKYIKEILDFNVGTIVVLDKMAGELVDVVVNGKLIARGEVVVIDESYGCRITDIVSPSKRINSEK